MQKDENVPAHLDAGSMLSQKTNEDFNKKQPTPNDIKTLPPFPDMLSNDIALNQNEDRKKKLG